MVIRSLCILALAFGFALPTFAQTPLDVIRRIEKDLPEMEARKKKSEFWIVASGNDVAVKTNDIDACLGRMLEVKASHPGKNFKVLVMPPIDTGNETLAAIASGNASDGIYLSPSRPLGDEYSKALQHMSLVYPEIATHLRNNALDFLGGITLAEKACKLDTVRGDADPLERSYRIVWAWKIARHAGKQPVPVEFIPFEKK